MGQRFLLDTNTTIYLCNGLLPQNALDFLKIEIQQGVFLSIISEIELLGFQFPTIHSEFVIKNFIAGSSVIELTRPIVSKTIDIRKSLKIKLPDAIIAATALVHNLTLISRNDSDFKKITGLAYLNPFTDI